MKNRLARKSNKDTEWITGRESQVAEIDQRKVLSTFTGTESQVKKPTKVGQEVQTCKREENRLTYITV
ncbi:MAG: hypothetical protein ACR2NF_01535 [Pirellulales bacterium]